MSELTREQEYEIVSKNLASITSLRRFCNQKDYKWLLEVKDKLDAILDERKDEEEKRELALIEEEEKRLKAIAYIESLGLDPDVLTISVFDRSNTGEKKSRKKARKEAEPRYRFTDPETGQVDTWTGLGRMKKGLRALIESGNNLEQYLITDNENTSNQ